jgi:hypothetical protein
VKRKSLPLVNSQGYRGQGTVTHRISRRTAIVGNFQYLRFEFPKVYANSDIFALAVGVQRTLTRNLQLDAMGGLYRITTSAIATVELSPEVAEILGRPTGTVAFLRTERPPLVEATLSYLQERGRAYIAGSSGINPGNGIYLTTSRATVNGGYSYSGIRKLSLGVSAGWSRTGSVALDLEDFNMWQWGGGFT